MRTAQDYDVTPRLEERWRTKAEVATATECWGWSGSFMRDSGYAQLHVKLRNGRWSSTVAHRVGYEIHRGSIPDGLVLDHLCRNRGCVNPDHLEAVDDRTNILRGIGFSAKHARKTSCPQGHEYDLLNTHVDKGGMRHCRACFRDRARAKRERACVG